MSWTRLDDLWTEQPIFESVSLSARWHYLAMIQACSRTERVDGRLSARAARRCSDVDDPDTALVELAAVRLIVTEGEDYRLPLIGDHVPPPSVREASKRGKERMRRHRAHRAGDHTMCLPANCPEASAVAGEVTGNTSNADENRGEHARDVAADVARNTGTGRDGTGQASMGSATQSVTGSDPWPEWLLCSVCCNPMPRDLAEREGWTCHPACDADAA